VRESERESESESERERESQAFDSRYELLALCVFGIYFQNVCPLFSFRWERLLFWVYLALMLDNRLETLSCKTLNSFLGSNFGSLITTSFVMDILLVGHI